MTSIPDNASITVTMKEYRRLTGGLTAGGVALVAGVAFAVGVVVGMSTIDEPDRPGPTPTRSVVIQPQPH